LGKHRFVFGWANIKRFLFAVEDELASKLQTEKRLIALQSVDLFIAELRKHEE
jgi:hypothetical protein